MPDLWHHLERFKWLAEPKQLVQLLLLGYACVWIWRRIIGTQAERLVKGIAFISIICLVCSYFGLTIITSILQHLIPVAVIAFLITFQPEVRRGLGYLGRMQTFKIDFSLRNIEVDQFGRDISEIITALKELSRHKTGALIVIEPPEGERDYLSPGTTMNADISSNLLLTIFVPRSPLHDGAVVIRQHKIIAAGVILPMTGNPKLSTEYGTRHRAAIGLSEIYDGLCIVVSEETGSISAASRGVLARYAEAEELAGPLASIYGQALPTHLKPTATPWQSFLSLFRPAKQSPSPLLSTTTPGGVPVGMQSSNAIGATQASATQASATQANDGAAPKKALKLTEEESGEVSGEFSEPVATQ
jgi:diadenylate cyclase